MSVYEYNIENYGLCWVPETAYRTTANGKDTANLATDTFFQLPIRITQKPVFGMLINKQATFIPGTVDYGYLGHHGYILNAVQLTGELYNLDWIKPLMGACSTTGPSGSDYTHTYITTTARASYPPSFQLLEKIVNDTSANNKYLLHVGCVIVRCDLKGDQNNLITATFTVMFARTITGLALNTFPPLLHTERCHDFENATVTHNVGGSAYNNSVKGWTIVINNNVQTDRAAGELYPDRALWGFREISIGLDLTPKDWADFTDAETDPATAKDIDITIKMSRNTTSDYLQFAFEKLWVLTYDAGTYSHLNRYLRRQLTYILNTYESGYKLTITQVDQKTNARF